MAPELVSETRYNSKVDVYASTPPPSPHLLVRRTYGAGIEDVGPVQVVAWHHRNIAGRAQATTIRFRPHAGTVFLHPGLRAVEGSS